MTNIIKSPRGTRDILPIETINWLNVEAIAQSILAKSGYAEIRTPIFEETILFKRGIGEGTDIVNKEMYNFLDQGNRELTLRPEGTAGVVRAFIEKQLHKNKLVNRLWYKGPMFRYERPQSGRQRQFHQLGVECLGTNDPQADFEVILLAIDILKGLQIDDFILEINSVGNFSDRQKYIVALKDFLNKYKDDLDSDSIARLYINPFRIFDTKNKKTQEILNYAPILSNFLDNSSRSHFDSLCNYLSDAHINYAVNNKLVRGLDYYTYTAFEIKTKNLGSQDTICGGGRYNHLVKQLQGPNMPAVGWGMGLDRLLLLLEQKQILNKNFIDFYIAIIDSNANNLSIQLINFLKKIGFTTELDLSKSRIQKQLKRAAQLSASACIIIGQEEVQTNTFIIKWLNSGNQYQLHLNDLSNIKKIYLEELIRS
uniref:Histidine--tRNA ligase, chloroplastic n=1 Tax=Flintiella sanguinaria TaxID=101926 RepID=A0A1X9PU74_9RHOD|nr:histidine tRNA synthetase [Flintiella sanguinaria]